MAHSISSVLWQLDAVTLAHMVKTRRVSVVEVVDAHLDRLQQVNPRLNAVVQRLDESARAEARNADAMIKRGDPIGPLHGVPITIKVNIDQAGCATDNGVVAYKDHIAQEDSPTVRNFKRAGAIIIGRSNTPAFSMRWFTDNALHGQTLNPWNPAHTPGGSSGGAAASVAAGMAPIGHGNDIAGSVRYPAYCCGLVGLRPSYGRVPAYNPSLGTGRPISAQLMAVQGPLTRTTRDARLALQVMAQGDINDPKWVDVPLRGTEPPRPILVAMVENPAGRAVQPQVAAAVTQAARWLEDAGYRVEPVDPPNLAYVADLWARIGIDDVIARLMPEVQKHGDDAIKKALDLWCQGFKLMHPGVGPADVLEALIERETQLRLWQLFLQDYPLVLMPSSGEQAFENDLDIKGMPTLQRIWEAQLPQLVVPVLGLPAVAIPTGTHGDLPVGVQLIASRFREDLCLDAAEVIEAHAQMSYPFQ